jgi:hypothetical protein
MLKLKTINTFSFTTADFRRGMIGWLGTGWLIQFENKSSNVTLQQTHEKE